MNRRTLLASALAAVGARFWPMGESEPLEPNRERFFANTWDGQGAKFVVIDESVYYHAADGRMYVVVPGREPLQVSLACSHISDPVVESEGMKTKAAGVEPDQL